MTLYNWNTQFLFNFILNILLFNINNLKKLSDEIINYIFYSVNPRLNNDLPELIFNDFYS